MHVPRRHEARQSSPPAPIRAGAARTRSGAPPKPARAALAATTLAPLACAVVLCGCGSSTVSRSEYSAKANAVCATADRQTAVLVRHITSDAVALSGGGVKAVARLAGAVQDLHDETATDLAQLQKMQQPSGDRAAIERFLTPFATVVTTIGRAAAMLTRAPQQAVAALEQLRPTAEKAIAGARAYGLERCEGVFTALA